MTEKLLALCLLMLLPRCTANAANIDYENGCPTGCHCELTHSGSRFSVTSSNGRPPVDTEQFAHQLDTILSSDQIAERLTSLSITYTPLTRVPASVCQLLNLTSLNLHKNNITELPDNCFTKLTKLVSCSADENSIVGLQDGLFDGLQSLVSLSLSRNKIAFIGLRLFSNSSDLINLRWLDLSYNRLTSLEPWWYYRCILSNQSSPVNIVLRFNMISNFTNNLNFQFRCGMKRPFGKLDIGENRIVHLMDVFSGWNIRVGDSLICLRNMHGPHPRMHLDFSGKYYACDCVDFWFYKLIKSFVRGDFFGRYTV